MKGIDEIRSDFPILSTKVYGRQLVYFDNGATTQKPRSVTDAVSRVYNSYNSNIHRGVHALSDQASEEYENAREKVRAFINAERKEEVIFTSGATGSINAVAFSFGEKYIGKDDEILISTLEHHANIVPWQMLCERKEAVLKVIPVDGNGELDISNLGSMINGKTRIVALTQVSNAFGVKTPVKEIISEAHKMNIPVLIDGAQGIQHGLVDVREMDCDFYVFSGHKIYGPAGIGILYGKEKWLEELPPYQGGGDMVENVSFSGTTYNQLPFKFEAGTTNYPAAIGLGAALDYVNSIGRTDIQNYEDKLQKYALGKLREIEGLRIYGETEKRISTISFLLKDIHQYDTGMILDKLGIAVRTGTHCAQPLMQRFGIDGTVRASMCFYNTFEEVDQLATGIVKVISMMRK